MLGWLRWAAETLWAAPGRGYAFVYAKWRLNRHFHAWGLPARAQLALLPRSLEVDRRLMSPPYWVPVASIRWGGRPAGGERRKGPNGRGAGLVLGGDWDLEDKRPIDDYLEGYIYSRAVIEIFRDAKPPETTAQFAEMCAMVEHGGSEWQARGCRNTADVRRYFERMRKTFDAIRANGYRSQAELGLANWSDEIKVFVDRNGELHKLQGAGHHRLTMARLLGLMRIPVMVIGVHRDWALRMQARYGTDVITAVDRALLQLDGEVKPAGGNR